MDIIIILGIRWINWAGDVEYSMDIDISISIDSHSLIICGLWTIKKNNSGNIDKMDEKKNGIMPFLLLAIKNAWLIGIRYSKIQAAFLCEHGERDWLKGEKLNRQVGGMNDVDDGTSETKSQNTEIMFLYCVAFKAIDRTANDEKK